MTSFLARDTEHVRHPIVDRQRFDTKESRMVNHNRDAKIHAPLHRLNVADFGAGMAAALIAKFLAELGAQVHRAKVDGDASFDEIYPAHRQWRAGLAPAMTASLADKRALLESADICILGGETSQPDILQLALDTKATTNPRLIIATIIPSLTDPDFAPDHGADILVQARAGLVFESYPDRPALLGFVPSAYGAALNALIAIATSLYLREADGLGRELSVGLLEGAMTWPLAFWGHADTPTPRYVFRAPRGARALIFPTRDGTFVQIVLGSAGAKYNLYRVLGIADESVQPGDAGMPNPNDGPARYFGDVDRIAPFVALRESNELVAELEAAGVVCEIVGRPAENWDDPQIESNAIIGGVAGTRSVLHPISWSLAAGRRVNAGSNAGAPLAGIRVLDFGAFVAGPMVSTGLADLGADVIKVEPPRGDPLRNIYRFYIAANRGKRSISIEMKHDEGLKLAQALARDADIVCTNYRHGVAERFGIDAVTLLAAQPEKIVVCNAGYGTTGPKAHNPAFDPCIQAMCGLEARAGGAGNVPILNPMMMTDICGGLLGQIGAIVALYRRARAGGGASLTVPLLNAGLFLLSDIVREDGATRGPIELLPDQTGYHATEKLYRTRDGWIAVAARDERSAQALACAFHIEIAQAKRRSDWSDPEISALTAAIGELSTSEAMALLAAACVPAEICRRQVEENFLQNGRNVSDGLVYEERSAELGTYRGLSRLFRLEGLTFVPRGHVSARGADTRDILSDLGLSPVEIAELLSGKVVSEDHTSITQAA
jgi:crotonobetainyl-CoA:carnitine CoA-transferase CaiB-like acyl-CoA transferase